MWVVFVFYLSFKFVNQGIWCQYIHINITSKLNILKFQKRLLWTYFWPTVNTYCVVNENPANKHNVLNCYTSSQSKS